MVPVSAARPECLRLRIEQALGHRGGHSIAAALGRMGEAAQALRQAWSWIVDQALPQLPDACRDSFLNRCATHVAALGAATRRLALSVPAAAATAREFGPPSLRPGASGPG